MTKLLWWKTKGTGNVSGGAKEIRRQTGTMSALAD
jgi:hypothetical protein